VAHILGNGKRQRTRVFTELQSHYLFKDRFGRPGEGNDKGKVEGLVGYARRNVSCSAREKSQPRNGAGEIFITAAAEIARATVSATNRFEHDTGNPRKFATKRLPRKTIIYAISST